MRRPKPYCLWWPFSIGSPVLLGAPPDTVNVFFDFGPSLAYECPRSKRSLKAMNQRPARPGPRPGVLDIAAYVPGRSKAPDGVRLHKLSSNETPLGPSPAALAAYHEAAGKLDLYPDGSVRELRAAIAASFGLNPDRIVCGAGSDDILFLMAHGFIGHGEEGIYTEHGFAVYPIAIRAAGGVPVVAPEKNLTTDVDAILARVTAKTRVVFIANPNNPTGTYIPFDEVRRLHAGLPPDVILVLDAAYAEYVRRNDYESGIELAATVDNVVMTRTFSKIHGLAGLRIGWCYATGADRRRAQPHPRAVQRLARRRSPRVSPRSAIAATPSAPSPTTRCGCRR